MTDFEVAAANPQIASNFVDLVENLDPAKPETDKLLQAIRDLPNAEARLAFDGGATGTMYGRRHVKVQEPPARSCPMTATPTFCSSMARAASSTRPARKGTSPSRWPSRRSRRPASLAWSSA